MYNRAHALINEDVARCSVYVPVERSEAFDKFGRDFRHWWPRDCTWSGEALESTFFEGRKGGAVWELGPEGYRCDFAKVLRYMPPDWMLLRWQVNPDRTPQPDPDKCSEIEIRFVSDDRGGTRIELEHRHFARHGAGWQAYCAAMAAWGGWPRILECFASYCGAEIAPPVKQIANRPAPVAALLAAE